MMIGGGGMALKLKFQTKELQQFFNIVVNKAAPVVKHVSEHKSVAIGGVITSGILVDDIRVRLKRKKDNKYNSEIQSMQKNVLQRHEAEIKVLKEVADKVPELEKVNDMLIKAVIEKQTNEEQ